MPAKRYKVTLEPDERAALEKLISRGKGAARRLAHARILLHADQGEGRPGRIDAEIAEAVGVSVATIERVRQRFVEEGLETALSTSFHTSSVDLIEGCSRDNKIPQTL